LQFLFLSLANLTFFFPFQTGSAREALSSHVVKDSKPLPPNATTRSDHRFSVDQVAKSQDTKNLPFTW